MTLQQSGYKMPPPPKRSNANSGWTRKAAIIFVALALVAAATYAISINGQKNTALAELSSTQAQLTSMQNDLTSARQTLASTQTEPGSTKTALAATQPEPGATRQPLTPAPTDLNSKNNPLDWTQILHISANQTLFSIPAQLSATQQQLAAVNTQLQAAIDENNLMLLQYASLRASINSKFGLTATDRQSFFTPSNPAVNSTVINNWGSLTGNATTMWHAYDSMYRWTIKNITYSKDSYVPELPATVSGSLTWVADYWRTPEETLHDQTGDCEDMSFLLASMMQDFQQNRYAVWAIEIQSNVPGTAAHMAVALPVAKGELSIVDPAEQYYTGINQGNSLSSEAAASALAEWLEHWSQQIPGAYVSRIFSQNEDHAFTSNAEFLTWMSQR